MKKIQNPQKGENKKEIQLSQKKVKKEIKNLEKVPENPNVFPFFGFKSVLEW